MLMLDVRTMLTISNVTEWKIRMITFSFVPTWLAAKIFKNGRVVEEPKYSKTDCSNSVFQ